MIEHASADTVRGRTPFRNLMPVATEAAGSAHSIADLRDDFELYASKYLWIVNAERAAQLLNFNVVQKRIHDLFDPRVKRGRVFMYVLKARQEGVSTYAEARIFHSAHLFPRTKAGVIADEVERAETIFKMSRMFYEKLPVDLRPMTRYSTKRELLFENPSKHGRFTQPGLGSSIEVFTAGNANVGRGSTFNVLHLSEFAFYPNGPAMIEALMPTIHQVPGHFAILETTADQAGSFAHDEWLRYKREWDKSEGNCELIPVFLAWHDLPAYSRPFVDESSRKQFIATQDDEERTLKKRFKLSYEQLNWRRDQIRLMRGDVDSFRHEYPSDDEECWIFAGVPVFDRKQLNQAWNSLPENYWQGEISPEGMLTEKREGGRLKVYRKPDRTRQYVLGVDPSGGSVDEAVIQVIDKESLEQVAEWSGVIGGVELARYIYPLGLAYGGRDEQALLAIEINGGWGITPMNELATKYYNMYRWPRFDTLSKPDSSKIGWETNVRTKPLLVDFGEFCFNRGYCKVNSEDLLKEMSTFIRDDLAGRAQRSSSDNKVMAWLIAVFVAGSGRSDLLGTSVAAPQHATSMDKLMLHAYGRTLETQYDEHWDDDEPRYRQDWMSL